MNFLANPTPEGLAFSSGVLKSHLLTSFCSLLSCHLPEDTFPSVILSHLILPTFLHNTYPNLTLYISLCICLFFDSYIRMYASWRQKLCFVYCYVHRT